MNTEDNPETPALSGAAPPPGSHDRGALSPSNLRERVMRAVLVIATAGVAYYIALSVGEVPKLWRGFGAAHAVTKDAPAAYDLTRLVAINDTLKKIQSKYVDPERIRPRRMFVSALNQVQREVAQVIVLHEERSPTVRVRVDTEESEFRVDDVQGLWDVSARLREVFAFLQKHLTHTDVDLREIEYAACNGILSTLDPHSVFLSPEAYGEMNLSTSGHFGGLGIVISIRDQLLTIMRPMPGTPAGHAGLRRLDRITKINNESTLNMPLDDAVKRLRGEPASKVTIWVHRDGKDGWIGARPFELTREEIRIESVDSKELAPGIGYVRIKQFQATSADELVRALANLGSPERLEGLVLDLRFNPGGLLDQAARVADTFLDRGVIVATVGASEGRDEKRARRRDTEPEYPIVVLTNEASASASEIVAGALKNHDRAIIVGQTTFGKGTVQLVFSGMADGAALKLTIAQYLTPGDISIQGVGVTPDIELDPMTADPLEMDLYRSEPGIRERDLAKSIGYGASRSADRPFVTLKYNLPESERAMRREFGDDVNDEFRMDFSIRFARDLLKRLQRGRRPEQLESAKGLIDAEQEAQLQAVSRELERLGIDWSKPPSKDYTGPALDEYEVKVSTDRTDNTVTAGEPMSLKVSVTNKGAKPAYQLRAITQSDSSYYDEKELVFGKVDPGQTKTVETPLGECKTDGREPGSTKPIAIDAPRACKIPLDAITRQDVVKIRFKTEAGDAPRVAEFRPTVRSLPQPSFAYTYQIVDNIEGNGDGQISRGEKVSVYFDVKNIGKGPSYETQALLSNLSGDGLLLRAGRFDISKMLPGEMRRVVFTFDVLDSLPDNLIKFEISAVDRSLHVAASEKVTMPVVNKGVPVKEKPGFAKMRERAQVRSQPTEQSRAIGALTAGSIVERLGETGGFAKLSLGDGRFGFVAVDKVQDADRAGSHAFEPLFSHSPPWLEVEPASLATTNEVMRIQGAVTDPDQVLDGYMFVGARKVFYQSNRKNSDPHKMTFAHDVKLSPGVNVITVVARENEETRTAYTLVVRRDGPNGEALQTPERQEFGVDWEFGSASDPGHN